MTRPLSSDPCLTLTGDNLTVADAAHILHGQIAELRVAPAARRRVEQARRCLHDLLEQGATLYGVNTGFGKLASQRIEAQEVLALQENLLRSHAVGMGPLLESWRQPARSRPAHSGSGQGSLRRHAGVDRSTRRDVQPRRGARQSRSRAASAQSGDLAPLAHLALVVMGEGHAFVIRPSLDEDGRRSSSAGRKPLSGRAALRRVHLKPYRPRPRRDCRSSTAPRSARPSWPRRWCEPDSSPASPTSPAP